MSQALIFLDLDRTLYRTNAAGVAKWDKIGKLYPQIDATIEHDKQHDFYKHIGDMYTYDFTAHILSLNLDVAAVYAALRDSELADGRLEYDGVQELVTWARAIGEVKVLTYGMDDYQRLKAALCPSLEDIEVVTTLGAKADYLQRQPGSWLIDDKPIGDTLPETVQFIQACLERQHFSSDRWPVATSLQRVQEILAQAHNTESRLL